MTKPVIMLNGLKIIIMLGMLVITLCGIRFAVEVIVPFILALFTAVTLNPLAQHMVRRRVPYVLTVSTLMTIIAMAMVLLLTYLGSTLNELTRTLPQYHDSIMTPLQASELLLQRAGIDVPVNQLAHYIDPSAAMMLLVDLLAQLPNAMSSIFLLLLAVLFILLEVPQLPGKSQQMMARPVEGMTVIQRVIDSVPHYLALKTTISIIIDLVTWAMLAAFDVRFTFIWGLLAFMPNHIPNTGSVPAAILPITQVLVFSGFYEVLLVLTECLLINLVSGNILEPHVMGRGLGLSTLVVLLSLIFWRRLLGPVDMLLSVPLTIIVRIALE